MKFFCSILEESSHGRASCALAWTGLAPPQDEVLCWLVIAGRVSTADMLRRRGLSFEGLSDLCVLCGVAEELADLHFIHCEVASSIWNHLFW